MCTVPIKKQKYRTAQAGQNVYYSMYNCGRIAYFQKALQGIH